MGMGKRWRKVIYVVKLKLTQPQTKYKTTNFPNLGSLNKKLSSRLVDFRCLTRGWGVWVNPLKNENSWRKPFSENFGLGSKKF